MTNEDAINSKEVRRGRLGFGSKNTALMTRLVPLAACQPGAGVGFGYGVKLFE